MKVYLFSDYLNSIHGEELSDKHVLCEIGNIDEMPRGVVSIRGKLASVCSMSKDYITVDFLNGILNEDEVDCEQEITCPHCGHQSSDSWEASDSDDKYECGVCESLFSYERVVDVTYSSKIIKRNSEVLELK